MKRGTLESAKHNGGTAAARRTNKKKKKNSNSPLSSSSPQSARERDDVIITSSTSTSSKSSSISTWNVPTPNIVQIFDYLDNDALINVCSVSKQSLDVVRNGPIQNKLIRRIEISASSENKQDSGRTFRLFKNLLHQYRKDGMEEKFQLYHHINVKDVEEFGYEHDDGDEIRMSIDRKMEWSGVVSLDLSSPSQLLEVLPYLPFALSYVSLPNLKVIDLSNLGGERLDEVLGRFIQKCPRLQKIIWINAARNSSIYIDGLDMAIASNLKEIIMDDSCFYVDDVGDVDVEDFQNLNAAPGSFIFHRCRKLLERVSIRNAKWHIEGSLSGETSIPQEALIKFIRNAPPSLRYFGSDLTQKNIDVLKLVRPEIEFVN